MHLWPSFSLEEAPLDSLRRKEDKSLNCCYSELGVVGRKQRSELISIVFAVVVSHLLLVTLLLTGSSARTLSQPERESYLLLPSLSFIVEEEKTPPTRTLVVARQASKRAPHF